MEKIVIKNEEGKNLVGILHSVSGSFSIIIMCHGFTGDKDEHGRYVRFAEEFSNSGYNVFRFDFAGSGESDAVGITVKGELNDLKSVLSWAKSLGYNKIGLFGHSLGGLVCLSAYSEDIAAMVLTAPVTYPKTPNKLKSEELEKEFANRGHVIIKNSLGREFRIEAEYLNERENLNQEKLCRSIKIPVMIIHGDQDTSVRLSGSQKAMEYLPKGSQLIVVEGSGHDMDDLDAFIGPAVKWFESYLPK